MDIAAINVNAQVLSQDPDSQFSGVWTRDGIDGLYVVTFSMF
jgi:hypothetical protein